MRPSIDVVPAGPAGNAARRRSRGPARTVMAMALTVASIGAIAYTAQSTALGSVSANETKTANTTTRLDERRNLYSSDSARRLRHEPVASPTSAAPAPSEPARTVTTVAPTTAAAAPTQPAPSTTLKSTSPAPTAPASSSTTAKSTAPSSFPDASTTGWRHTGVTLHAAGPMTITQNGAVIDSADITGNVVIQANNVTVKRSRITAGGYWPVIVVDGYTGFQLIDSQIVGVQTTTNVCKVGATGPNMTLTRVDISNCEDGVHPGDNVTVQDSYIHDLWFGTDASGVRVVATHNDGIQVMGATNINILHNTIETGHSQNSAVFLKADMGPISNVRIDSNFVDGGGYTVYGQDTAAGTVTNVSVTNNIFGPSFVYGLLITSSWTGPTVVSGNFTTTGQPV
jgi:hypothetical protein